MSDPGQPPGTEGVAARSSRWPSIRELLAVAWHGRDTLALHRRGEVAGSGGLVLAPRFTDHLLLQELLARLPPLQRLLLQLWAGAGYSQAELARLLHCSERTVARECRAARAAIEELLDEADPRPGPDDPGPEVAPR
jgi:hypothetical protein